MIFSARNQLKGRVVAVHEGSVNSLVDIEIASGLVIHSVITRSAIEELGLSPGKEAYAVIKASAVMIGVDH